MYICLIIAIIFMLVIVGILCFAIGEVKGWKDGVNLYKEYLQANKESISIEELNKGIDKIIDNKVK